MLPLPISVHGRVSDIWRSYIGQRLLLDTDRHVVFTAPRVVQHRKVHNYLADLESENDLYLKSGVLINFLLSWNPPPDTPKTVPARYEQLLSELYERGYIEIEDIRMAQTWLASLQKIGYKFPAIVETPLRQHSSQELQPVYSTNVAPHHPTKMTYHFERPMTQLLIKFVAWRFAPRPDSL